MLLKLKINNNKETTIIQKDIVFFLGAAIHSLVLLNKPIEVVKQISNNKSFTNFISYIEIKSLNIY